MIMRSPISNDTPKFSGSVMGNFWNFAAFVVEHNAEKLIYFKFCPSMVQNRNAES